MHFSGRNAPLLFALVMLAASLGVSVALWRNAQTDARRTVQADFDFRVRELESRIVQRAAIYEQVLRGVSGFLLGSIRTSPADFRSYIDSLRLEQQFPGIQGVGIAEIIAPGQLASHEAAMRRQGFLHYALQPAYRRETYTAITRLEPLTAMNLRALGYDMYSEPVRRAAMEAARDNGAAALTGKVILVQEGKNNPQPGFLMYLPVYRGNVSARTLRERRAAIAGWVYAPFRIEDFMRAIGGERSADLSVTVYDGDAATPDACLYGCAAASAGTTAAMLAATRPLNIAGRPWLLQVRSQPVLFSRLDSQKPQLILTGGIVTSLLLALLVWALTSARSRATALALDMTRALRDSQLRWKYALEGAGDGVWDWDRASGKVTYSHGWKAMLGYEDQEIGDDLNTWERLLHPDDRAASHAALAGYLAGRTPTYINEYRMRCRDGSWKWVLTRGMAVSRDAAGAPLRLVGTHTDITERRNNEEALRMSLARIASEQRRIRVILDNSHDAFIAIGVNGDVTDWNKEAGRIFGWSAEEAIGRDLAQLIIPPELREAHNAGLRRFTASGEGALVNRRLELEAVHRDGRRIPVELAVASVQTDAGYTTNAFIRDISQQKAAAQREAERLRALEDARAALQHAQKLEAVGKLTGGVAHDFNNVLQIIAGNLQLLMDAPPGPDAGRRLQSALGAVDRGAKLASQLLAFARRQPLQPVVIDVRRLLADMDELLRRALGDAISVESVTADDLWHTLVDPSQLENVILNLVINARDAMEDGGKLSIELANATLDDGPAHRHPDLPPGDYVLLGVSDTGAGMSAEVLEHAFEPFFTTKPPGQGTGLGLSMAYGFVKQSGGHIRIHSAPGRGTTVRIYLPRSHGPEHIVEAPSRSGVIGGTETILVVEDDLAVQETVEAMLSGLGYRVLTAGDGAAALAILRRGEAIDLLFTDVVMPGPLRSPDMARQAAQIQPGLAVLFTSGYTQDAIVRGGRLEPGVELLSKPYRREQLARKIRQVLDKARAMPAAGRAQAAVADLAAPAQVAAVRGVLVVEDDDDLRQMACDLITLLGYAPAAAASAEDALAALATRRFDIMLADIGLPGMDGIALARRARGENQALRVIFATGHVDAGSEAARLGSAILKKPYNLAQLQRALEEACELN